MGSCTRLARGVMLLGGWLAACGGPESTASAPRWTVWQPLERAAHPARPQPTDELPSGPLPKGAAGLSPVIDPSAVAEPGSDEPWQDFPVYGSTFHFLAHVYEAPEPGARRLAYLRRGATFRAGEELGRDGCSGGWHALWGGGFICRGEGYRLHARQPDRDEAHPAPNRLHALPYRYAKVVARTAQTWVVPNAEQEAELRVLWEHALAQPDGGVASALDAGTPPVDGEDAAADGGAGAELPRWVRMLDEPGHYVSVASEVQRDDGKTFLRTVRGAYLPLDATLEVAPPPGLGSVLSERTRFPLGVARGQAARVALSLDGTRHELAPLGRGQVVELSGRSRRLSGALYLETTEGDLVRARRLAVVQRAPRPALVPREARWVHVDTAAQTLVAYEGERPVFVTLVSSGKAGFETPPGLHRLHAKHVATTMDDTALEEGAYYIEDVPWTMYFDGSYALHGAFWHDRFGHARSHGCVNLTPADAHFLFEFLTPRVPGGYHGVLVPGERPSYVWVEAPTPGPSTQAHRG